MVLSRPREIERTRRRPLWAPARRPFCVPNVWTPPQSAITRVQFATAFINSGTTLSATFGTPVTAGNLIVITSNTASALSGTPSGYLLAANVDDFCATNIIYKTGAGGETAPAVTLLSSAPGAIVIAEYSGIATTSPLDKTVTNKPSAFASTIASGTTAATTQADELAIAAFGSIRTSHPTNTFSGYTNSFVQVGQAAATTGDADMVAMVEKILTATGTQTSTATLSGGAEQRPVGAMATFKAASAGAAASLVIPSRGSRALYMRRR